MSEAGSAALLLASRSPRRADLLRTLGIAFAVIDVDIDETPWARETPGAYVRRLARMKAEAGHASLTTRSLPVLAADTTVVLDGSILGKPRDTHDARSMLRRLSGRVHEVLTGVALIDRSGAIEDIVVTTHVSVRVMNPRSIDAYVASGEPADKAGAYGIQGLGGALVDRIDGSYSNVVGLPLVETLDLLDAAGVPHALNPTLGSV